MESNTAAKNKRIAKNTVLLYARMILIMGVTLYTSRVVLRALGDVDYGLFNVVGGVIVVLGFLTGSLSGASSRFITYALGKNDMEEVKKTFSTICCIHLLFAAGIVVLGETAGLWFVYHKMVIPAERMTAALWVYHCSVATSAAAIVSVPYNALIIARERMSAFAYVSLAEALLKLLAAWTLLYTGYDKLVIYAVLYLGIQLLVRLLYGGYCSRHFAESRAPLRWDGKTVKEIIVYAGWTVNGQMAVVGYTQGINILLNLFFGPVVNAARAIAVQVQTATMMFVQNFQTAIRPQIIKSCSAGDFAYMHTLVIASSKYGFFLMLLLIFPLVLCIEPVLRLWLGQVPAHTVEFAKIVLYIGLLEPFSLSLISAIHATGDIKKFQLFEATSLLTIVPISYLLLKTGHASPETVMWVYFFVALFTQAIRIWIVLPKIGMSYLFYLKKIVPRACALIVCFVVPLHFFHIPAAVTWWVFALYAAAAAAYIGVCIGVFGFEADEWRKIIGFLRKRQRTRPLSE